MQHLEVGAQGPTTSTPQAGGRSQQRSRTIFASPADASARSPSNAVAVVRPSSRWRFGGRAAAGGHLPRSFRGGAQAQPRKPARWPCCTSLLSWRRGAEATECRVPPVGLCCGTITPSGAPGGGCCGTAGRTKPRGSHFTARSGPRPAVSDRSSHRTAGAGSHADSARGPGRQSNSEPVAPPAGLSAGVIRVPTRHGCPVPKPGWREPWGDDGRDASSVIRPKPNRWAQVRRCGGATKAQRTNSSDGPSNRLPPPPSQTGPERARIGAGPPPAAGQDHRHGPAALGTPGRG